MLTVKGVECFAVPNDGQRVVVVELVVELVRVGVGVGVAGLRRAGAVVRRVMLLAGVVRVTALGTGRRKQSRHERPVIFQISLY